MFKFTRLAVYPSVLTGKYMIEWSGEGYGIFKFQVEWGPNESGPWLKTGDQVVSLGTIVEVKDRPLSHTDPLWFRVVCTDETGKTFVSVSNSSTYNPDRRDVLIQREMIRRFNLELNKFTGSEGYLLRLKTFGEVAENVHPILGAPIGTEDKEGFGQKFKGAYWPPIHMTVAYMAEPPDGNPDGPIEEVGFSEKAQRGFFAMPYPIVRAEDIWVSAYSNSRYKVVNVDPVEYVGLRIKQKVMITRLPVTDPAYKVPIK